MLSQDEASALTEMLAAHEEATTNQVVVVTLPDLQGYPIENSVISSGATGALVRKAKITAHC